MAPLTQLDRDLLYGHDVILFFGALISFATVWLGWKLRKVSNRVDQVHVIVNSRFDKLLAALTSERQIEVSRKDAAGEVVSDKERADSIYPIEGRDRPGHKDAK